MSENDPISSAKTAMEVVGAVMKGAADDPQVKVAARELGKTAATLTKAINTFLLPLAVMNYAVEKARQYFEQRFSIDFEQVARKIPVDQIVEPKPSIAGPILQALAFAYEEAPLKQMYLELLASAMDGRVARDAHPAFVEIIKQMTSEEARLLRTVIRRDGGTPLIELRKRTSRRWLRLFKLTESFVVLARHVQDIVRSDTREPSEIPELPAMVDNWARLGLVEVSYVVRITDNRAYAWVDRRPELIRARSEHSSDSLWIVKGRMERTSFGRMFAIAVGLDDSSGHSDG